MVVGRKGAEGGGGGVAEVSGASEQAGRWGAEDVQARTGDARGRSRELCLCQLRMPCSALFWPRAVTTWVRGAPHALHTAALNHTRPPL